MLIGSKTKRLLAIFLLYAEEFSSILYVQYVLTCQRTLDTFKMKCYCLQFTLDVSLEMGVFLVSVNAAKHI